MTVTMRLFLARDAAGLGTCDAMNRASRGKALRRARPFGDMLFIVGAKDAGA